MLGEAVVVVRPPGKHDELLPCKRLSEGSLARSEVLCINEVALMDDGGFWECLYKYMRHQPGIRGLLAF